MTKGAGGRTRRTLTIDSVESLGPLRHDMSRGRPSHYRQIGVAVPQLSAEECADWQRRLENAYFACGCGEGAAGGAIGLSTYIVWALVRPAPLGWLDAAGLLLMLFIATGLGKAIGLVRSRRRLHVEVVRLAELLEERGAHRVPQPEKRPANLLREDLCDH